MHIKKDLSFERPFSTTDSPWVQSPSTPMDTGAWKQSPATQPNTSVIKDTAESSTITLSPIPESEIKQTEYLITLLERLRIIITQLDPRLSRDADGKPYDPIDLAFRILTSVNNLEALRTDILNHTHVQELIPGKYSHLTELT